MNRFSVIKNPYLDPSMTTAAKITKINFMGARVMEKIGFSRFVQKLGIYSLEYYHHS